MGKLHWSVTAQKNLEDIGNYIAQGSPFYAVNFVERILQCAEKACDFPNIGRIVPEFKREDIREMIFHKRLLQKSVNSRFCHGELVEPYNEINKLQIPFDRLRVTIGDFCKSLTIIELYIN